MADGVSLGFAKTRFGSSSSDGPGRTAGFAENATREGAMALVARSVCDARGQGPGGMGRVSGAFPG